MDADNQGTIQGICPHCHQELTVSSDVLGLNCPACDNRVIIRDSVFHTIESAKKQAETISSTSVEDSLASDKNPFYEVHLLIGQQKLIDALWLYREKTGVSMSEAKRYVNHHRKQQENIFKHPGTEYRRVCNQCNKVWHSLAKREAELRNNSTKAANSSRGAYCCNSSASLQARRNMDAIDNTLAQLKKCPECGSTNYSESVVPH